MDQTREKAVKPGGIFDQQPGASTASDSSASGQTQEKEDFKDPFREHTDGIAEREREQAGARMRQKLSGDDAAARTATALSDGISSVQKDLDELRDITPEDLTLAEKLIFDGYAEFEVEIPNFPGRKFTMCSTNAEEFTIVEDIIFKTVKEKEDKDGTVDLASNTVQSLRSGLSLALSYRGTRRGDERVELAGSERKYHLNTLKRAIQTLNQFELDGKLDEAENLKKSLYDAIKRRGHMIMRLPTPVIDYLSGKKIEFDQKMYILMNTKNIVPKS